jgi:hypothetical protein
VYLPTYICTAHNISVFIHLAPAAASLIRKCQRSQRSFPCLDAAASKNSQGLESRRPKLKFSRGWHLSPKDQPPWFEQANARPLHPVRRRCDPLEEGLCSRHSWPWVAFGDSVRNRTHERGSWNFKKISPPKATKCRRPPHYCARAELCSSSPNELPTYPRATYTPLTSLIHTLPIYLVPYKNSFGGTYPT